MAFGNSLQFRSSRIFSMPGMPVKLHLQATIGSSGAITLAAAPLNKGIVSITKLSTAGQYQIILTQAYNKLLFIAKHVANASGIEAAPDMAALSSSNVQVAATGITIQLSSGGVATNPASGDVLKIDIDLNNSDQM